MSACGVHFRNPNPKDPAQPFSWQCDGCPANGRGVDDQTVRAALVAHLTAEHGYTGS